uniref:Uncharacterized protein n=1 Tax=Amphimedon queenslandica TaxID=400682 RepID=A0A1X7U033_AMPQE
MIEDSKFYHNLYGFEINNDAYYLKLPVKRTINYHFVIKSCSMRENTYEGLIINGKFMRLTQIDIVDVELNGNGGNKITNGNFISLSNVTVANSHSTGLTLRGSFVIIDNGLRFRKNTGVVGGGIAINDTSRLILTSSAYLEFIDNHASYKGGGIYVDESTGSSIKLNVPNIPLTLINNSAGLVGDDMYGYYRSKDDYQFHLTNPSISSTGNAKDICFCDRHSIAMYENCLVFERDQQIYPGQTLKFYVALYGYDYFASLTPTDGIVNVYNDSSSWQLLNQTYIVNNCSLIEYTPKLVHTKHRSHILLKSLIDVIGFYYTANECPIGFSIDSLQGVCTCSQSVSSENVTCDIVDQSIKHNGLLWIGIYDTKQNDPIACIVNEDCLLYCSPNPVTFQLNDTDTQCVDNRGQRMCGSCRERYSLLMGSNKCGHCHNNYMLIAWIVLFAVMGVLLVVLLIALNLTVSVGTLNGLLFYANIIKLYEPVFSKKRALPVLSQVISWINLDF